MLPPLDATTGLLPPGIHDATWAEISSRFAGTPWRAELLAGFLAALKVFVKAGCKVILLDGSFVTAKPTPGDYDAVWETYGVDPGKLDPVLLNFDNRRAAMKAKYRGEFFPAGVLAGPGITFPDFFLRDRNGNPKGIVRVDLASLP